MNIIEKLGITPIKAHCSHHDGDSFFNYQEVRELEKQMNEMLKALIHRVQTDYIYVQHGEIDFRDIESDVKIIEKATGKSWGDIKETLN